jgi:hypothetical protein
MDNHSHQLIKDSKELILRSKELIEQSLKTMRGCGFNRGVVGILFLGAVYVVVSSGVLGNARYIVPGLH